MLTWPRFQNTDWHLSRSEFECYKNKTKQNKTGLPHEHNISGANSILYDSNKAWGDRTRRGPNAFDYENTM